MTTMNTTNDAALRDLNACWTDLTAAHRHAVNAASGLVSSSATSPAPPL